jgi:hypothetical protein
MGDYNSGTDEQGSYGQSRRISDSSMGRHIMLSPSYRLWTFHLLDFCPYQHIPETSDLTLNRNIIPVRGREFSDRNSYFGNYQIQISRQLFV